MTSIVRSPGLWTRRHVVHEDRLIRTLPSHPLASTLQEGSQSSNIRYVCSRTVHCSCDSHAAVSRHRAQRLPLDAATLLMVKRPMAPVVFPRLPLSVTGVRTRLEGVTYG
jgi:hypothetical protein